jgi:N6-L-threonylcarbamoyladenine synthase
MYIVGADTSCDDTSLGIIEYNNGTIKILANEIESQEESTTAAGGVVPNICAGNHTINMKRVFQKALQKANLTPFQIDLYSSTFAPGMIGSLIIGNTFISTIASLTKKNYIPIHHIEAHISAASIDPPFLALVVSGGHTLIAHYKSFGKYDIICSSVDDAAGEVFDKIGREMGLPFPAGPHIEKLAMQGNSNIKPISVMKGQLKFSFSGLKTAYKKILDQKNYELVDIAYSLQESIGNILLEKLTLAVKKTGIEKIVACGGVMCNLSIREKITSITNEIYFPPVNLCTDNGVMVALAALNHWENKSNMINNRQMEERASMSLDEWSSLILI